MTSTDADQPIKLLSFIHAFIHSSLSSRIAQFNSNSSSPPPICHPKDFIQKLCPFILHSSKRENSSAQQIIWLICYCRKMNNPFENTNNNQNIMEQGIRPLSWPHGVITSCRTVFLFNVLLARFASIFCGPGPGGVNIGELLFVVLFGALLLCESIYSWLYILKNGQIWTKMFLFYPILAVVMFVDSLCMVNLLNGYRLMAFFYPMGWPIFWASLEMISSLAIAVVCVLHLFCGQTFAIVNDEFRQLFARSMDIVQQNRRGEQIPNRNAYEDIQ